MHASLQDQLSVFVTNQPGEMAKVLRILGDKKINIGSIMVVDSTSQGVVRFVCAQAAAAQAALEEAGFFVALAQVVVVDVPNRPGALCELTHALGEAGINVDYAYASDNPSENFIRDTLKLSDAQAALKIIGGLK